MESLEDMDIELSPSFYVGQTPMYLKGDIRVFVEVVGGDLDESPVDDEYSNSWRRALKEKLEIMGISTPSAESYSQNVFPRDGMNVTELALNILEHEKDIRRTESKGTEVVHEGHDQNDSMVVETQIADAPMDPQSDNNLETLRKAMESENIPFSFVQQYPFSPVVQLFLEKKGGYDLPYIVQMIKSTFSKFNALSTALDSVSIGK
eukprot:TRINITY_DN6284_c0_g1_i1.p1 TRINITY_DN6284_c0_g1~~TRINITY_DN6284_c0_g1_i1.p1  ORF type:complete len:206 (-),score=26.41 TRINITY_DN6284_c0_g1_i1:43-660(-)